MKKTKFLAGMMSATIALSIAPVYALEQVEDERFTIEQEIIIEKADASTAKSTDTTYAVTGGNIYFDESTGTITGADTTIVVANIPEKINEVTVTTIGKSAFYNCTSLVQLTLSENLQIIGNNAFYGCTSLTSITIPNSVTSMGARVFYGCSSLAKVTLSNNLLSMGIGVFSSCTSLTSITIPNSVTSMGDSVFSGCSSLAKVTLSNNLLSMGSSVFISCTSLTDITIPDSVMSIGTYTFYNCSDLKTVYLSENLTSIPKNTFYNCDSLVSLNIPEKVLTINESAFSASNNLSAVFLPSSLISISSGAFKSCNNLTDIYYQGSSSDWNNVSINYTDNTYLGSSEIHYNSTSSQLDNSDTILIDAVLYTSYESKIKTATDLLIGGKLPTGLGIYSDGSILGIPTQTGTFAFTVYENAQHINYEITVLDNTDVNVESQNDYEIIERIPTIDSNLNDYVYEVSGEFSDFLNVYVNGKKLVENVDYTYEEGSTKITILSQTMSTLPSGSNTINATFKTETTTSTTPIVESVAQNFTKTVEPATTSSMPFSDVAMTSWYYDSVEYIYKKEIMLGTSDTTFSPTSNISHSMLVTILYRMSGETASAESKYTDVSSNYWYTEAINWAIDNNITTSKTSTTFAPNDLLNREETAVIVKNYCDYMGIYLPMTTSAEVPDLASVSDSAKDAVTEMYQRGFIGGDQNGNFNPKNNVSRAELATMLNNFLLKI